MKRILMGAVIGIAVLGCNNQANIQRQITETMQQIEMLQGQQDRLDAKWREYIEQWDKLRKRAGSYEPTPKQDMTEWNRLSAEKAKAQVRLDELRKLVN